MAGVFTKVQRLKLGIRYLAAAGSAALDSEQSNPYQTRPVKLVIVIQSNKGECDLEGSHGLIP